MPFAVGTRLGSYEVLAALGAGGMGEVYRARDTKLDRDVAIKILPETFAHDPVRIRDAPLSGRVWAVRSSATTTEFSDVHADNSMVSGGP